MIQQASNPNNEIELDVDPEHIMWLYHIKFFIELKRKYDTYIKFRGHRAYLEGPDISRVRLGQEEVKRKAREEFVYDFLMYSDNADESYAPYVELLSNQEYERMKKQYNGLYIFTRKQFMIIKQELSDKYGYIITFSKYYPVSFVLIFLPQNKQSFLLQRIQELVDVINKSLHQNVTPMNAQYFSYRNRDLASRNVFHKKCQIKVTELQAIQIFMVFDIRKIEEHFQISLSLSTYEQFVMLILQGQSESSCQQAATILENHLKNKTLFQIHQEQKGLIQGKQVIDLEEVESIANRLDQLFGTEILRRVTSMFGKCCFVFTVQEEVPHLRSKLLSEYHSSKFTNSNINMTSEVEVKQMGIAKDRKIQSKSDYQVVEFFNYKEGQTFYLFQNNFNEEEFQKDFEQLCKFKIEADYSVQNQLKFRVLYQDVEQCKKAIEFLDNYMNSKVSYVTRTQIQMQELEEIAEDFNCKFISYSCNAASGWSDDEIQRNEGGKEIAFVFTNLMHCFIKQLKKKVQQVVQKYQQVALLFESQYSYLTKQLADVKKLDLFNHFYLEDCYWVLIEGKESLQLMNKLVTEDEKLLNQALISLPVKQSEPIVLSQVTPEKDFYDVFIFELYHRYYRKMRDDYLKHCMPYEEWKNLKLTSDEKLFCVDLTDLNTPPLSLEPIIEEIASFDKQGRVIGKLTELTKGLYLIGRARGVDTELFQLQADNHLISSIVNIKE